MKRLAAACCAVLLGACGSFPWPPTDNYWLKAGTARPANRVESLLAYAEHVRGLSAAESAKEHERLKLAFAAKERNDFIRLQYAMLLAVSAGPGRDLSRARMLLEPLLRDEGGDAGLRRLALHLHAGVGDLLDAERRARDEHRRAGDLEQKLEALMSIERRIIHRSAPETRQ